MVRLASVEFTKLKNVRSGTRLTFAQAGSVLLGKNGTGKTTLLQYLVALCTADMSAFASDEPFDVSAAFLLSTGESASLRLTGTPNSQPAIPPDEASPYITRYLPASESTRLEYRVASLDRSVEYRVSIVDGQAELYRNEQSLCDPFSTQAFHSPLRSCLVRIEDLVRQNDGSPLSVAGVAAFEFWWIPGALCRYDESLDYFRMLTDENSTYLSMEMTFLDRGKTNASRIRGNTSRFPHDLFSALTQGQNANAHPAEFFSASHSNVGFLREFVKLCKFTGASAIAPIEASRPVGDGVLFEWKLLRFTFDLGRARISHAKLSFGQKRLFSYLYYLACNRQIGIADELVNGMHHEWIEYCLGEACADRQMFYTSQNPLLLDFLTFQSEAEVSQRLIACKWDEQDGFVWENLDARVGQEFYRLYNTGIQHVSDILRTKGWW